MTDNRLIGAVVLLLVGTGVLFWFGKGAWLIAGYNMLPRKRRARIDRRKLCRTMACFLFYCAAVVMIDRLAAAEGVVMNIYLHLGAIVLIVYANTGGRFEKR